MSKYGEEVILDLHDCDPETFNRESIEAYFKWICESEGMERCDLHWWDDLETPEEEKETEPHLVGTSAIQFIKTSNITIHTLDMLGKVFINAFTCGEIDEHAVSIIALKVFGGRIAQCIKVNRL